MGFKIPEPKAVGKKTHQGIIMKVAIIGGGISGLSVAEFLDGKCEYTLFEKSQYIGGHTDTHEILIHGKNYSVDTGFIVCNRKNYPLFFQILDKYKVNTQSSNMSFSVNNIETGLVYNATSISRLFCQKKNIFNPRFYRMIMDIFKFYRNSYDVLESEADITLGDYLTENNYSDYFINEHILPMTSALWSGDFESVRKFPLKYLLSFMQNHQMLQVSKRPEWRIISGGSQEYVKILLRNLSGNFLTDTEVLNITRNSHGVVVRTKDKEYKFDKVFFASHSDQTLKLISNPSENEKEILGGISYVDNTIDLHTDASIMPDNKKAWASWTVNNYPQSSDLIHKCTVNYYMNLLQNIDCPLPLIVSLNQSKYIDNDCKLKTIKYQHPVYTNQTINSQLRKNEIQGKNNSYFCGAYWGWGFHEDGVKSAAEAVECFINGVSSS